MSHANTFIARLQAEPALQQRLAATHPRSIDELANAVIVLAAEEGVTLTPTDLEAWRQAQTTACAAATPEGELSETQLDAIAGGEKSMNFLNPATWNSGSSGSSSGPSPRWG